MKTWKPDTCKGIPCIIEYEGESPLLGGEIDKQPSDVTIQVTRRCATHISIPDKDIYDIIREENQRKNGVWVEIIKVLPELESTPEKYQWSFDVQRNLEFSIASQITLKKQLEIETALMVKYDSKVIKK